MRVFRVVLIAMAASVILLDGRSARADDAAPQELLVINDQGEKTVLKLPLPADLPRQKVTVERDGKQEVYEGVQLATILEQAKVKLGADAKGPLVARYVLLTAADGYRVVLSISEVDAYLSGQQFVVADRHGGEPLRGNEAPLRLIVPADKHARRSIRQLAKIEVRSVDAK